MSFQMKRDTVRNYTSSFEFLVITQALSYDCITLPCPCPSMYLSDETVLLCYNFKELHSSKIETETVVFV